ncbi:MAG: hypothetical protein PHV13_04110 [Candidatus ainarchaeum sp.]|nr:hypothetical protein [Candidatus ainarchaeum sp.]
MNGKNGKMVAFGDREITRYGSHGIARAVLGQRDSMLPGTYFVNLAPLLEQGSVQRLWVSGKRGDVAFCASSGKQKAGSGVRKRVDAQAGKALEPLVEISYSAKHGDDSGFDIRVRYTSGEAITSVTMQREAAVAAGTL